MIDCIVTGFYTLIRNAEMFVSIFSILTSISNGRYINFNILLFLFDLEYKVQCNSTVSTYAI